MVYSLLFNWILLWDARRISGRRENASSIARGYGEPKMIPRSQHVHATMLHPTRQGNLLMAWNGSYVKQTLAFLGNAHNACIQYYLGLLMLPDLFEHFKVSCCKLDELTEESKNKFTLQVTRKFKPRNKSIGYEAKTYKFVTLEFSN